MLLEGFVYEKWWCEVIVFVADVAVVLTVIVFVVDVAVGVCVYIYIRLDLFVGGVVVVLLMLKGKRINESEMCMVVIYMK